MREVPRVNPAARLAGLLAGLTLAFTVYGADCYNDEVPVGSDLEPPIPGSSDELLRVSDDDVERILKAIGTYETRFRKSGATGPPKVAGPTRR